MSDNSKFGFKGVLTYYCTAPDVQRRYALATTPIPAKNPQPSTALAPSTALENGTSAGPTPQPSNAPSTVPNDVTVPTHAPVQDVVPPVATSSSGGMEQPASAPVNAVTSRPKETERNTPAVSSQEVNPATLRGKAYEDYRKGVLARNKAMLASLDLEGGAAAMMFTPKERKKRTAKKGDQTVRRSDRINEG